MIRLATTLFAICGVCSATSNSTPINIKLRRGHAQNPGAYLVANINLKNRDFLCSTLNEDLKIASNAINLIQKTQLKEPNFITKVTYLILSIEREYNDIIRYITSLSICPNEHHQKINDQIMSVQSALEKVWKLIKASKSETIIALHATRPPVHSYPLKPCVFPPILIGLGTGLITGGVLGTVFGSSTNSKEIEVINNNLDKVNKNIYVVNKKLELLSKEVEKEVGTIKTIFNRFLELDNSREVQRLIVWNLESIRNLAMNKKIKFNLVENTITLLRANIMNIELLDTTTLKYIVSEGINHFPNLMFPLEIIDENLSQIAKLIEIKDVGKGNFAAVIPLVTKNKFEIYDLLPLPVEINANLVMIAEPKEILLKHNNKYIIINNIDLHNLKNSTYITKHIHPIWDSQRMSCESEALNENLDNIMKICQFRKIGMDQGIHLTESQNNRMLDVADKTTIQLTCPDGKIKADLVGLHTVSHECDIKTETVNWPARQTKQFDIKEILTNSNNTYDIIKLPIIKITNQSNLHKSIKELIDNLPTNHSKLLDLGLELSLEEITSYSVIGYGILVTIIIIHSILIICIYIFKFKSTMTNVGNVENPRSSFRNSIRAKLPFSRESFRKLPRSAKNSIRNSFRVGRAKISNAKDSLRNLKYSYNNSDSRDIGTNTSHMYPEIILNNENYPGKYHNSIVPSAPILPMYK